MNRNGDRGGAAMDTGTERKREREQGLRRDNECKPGTGTGAGRGTEIGAGAETKERAQGGKVYRNGNGNEGCNGDRNGAVTGTGARAGTGSETGKGLKMKMEERGRESSGICHIRKKVIVEDQTLPFRARHHFCRQEVAPRASYQFRTQVLAPVWRCGTEGKTRHQGREGGHGDGNRDEGCCCCCCCCYLALTDPLRI